MGIEWQWGLDHRPFKKPIEVQKLVFQHRTFSEVYVCVNTAWMGISKQMPVMEHDKEMPCGLLDQSLIQLKYRVSYTIQIQGTVNKAM